MAALETLGKFRANPLANSENAIRTVSRDNPGTTATDSGTVALTGASLIQGIRYTGKDGAARFIPFTSEDQITQRLIPYTVAAASDGKAVQDAVHQLIEREEVESIVSITKTGDTLTVQHTGAGTLSAIVVDGADKALTRADVQGATVAVAAEADDKEDDKTKTKKGK